MSADVRWIRSYIVHFEVIGKDDAGIPTTGIFEVADTVVVRPDAVAVPA